MNGPLPKDSTEADFDRLEGTFYKPGTPVAVFAGGEKLGTATVRSSNIEGRDGGCLDLSAAIAYAGVRRPRLAANTISEIPGHNSTRRAATRAETSILRQLAEKWLLDYGLDRVLLRHATMQNIISTELRKKAGRALIGRFDVVSRRAIHRLFVIVEPNRGRYRLTLANLEIQHDVEDGVDRAERQYVDQLDINNDGIDEVITSTTHYESWGYSVWQFDPEQNVWRRAYDGVTGGC